jgi:non-heme chloroperoxidase
MALNELGRERDPAAGVDQSRRSHLLCGAAMAVTMGLHISIFTTTNTGGRCGPLSPRNQTGEQEMNTITVKDGTQIYFKDWGAGQPIVFSHCWPLSADDWDAQMLFFLKHGYRVIAHDRRGHGRSTQPGDSHDMDHYADDLAALTAHLDLKEAVHAATQRGAAKSCTIWRGTVQAAWQKL